jgi:hypothetical protein
MPCPFALLSAQFHAWPRVPHLCLRGQDYKGN